MAKKRFEVNFQDLFEIDTTPEAANRTWKRLGAGISSLSPSTNENVDQSAYLDGNGYGTSAVTSAQLTFSVSGHRVIGDPAQDFIILKEFELGDARESNFRFFDSQGVQRSGPCTIVNLQVGGGDAQGKKEIAFEIHINGKPEKIEPAEAAALTAQIAAGTKPGTVKATVAVGPQNKLAYSISAEAREANANSYPFGVNPYTSDNNIAAVNGQHLNLYELNEYDRVVKFQSLEINII